MIVIERVATIAGVLVALIGIAAGGESGDEDPARTPDRLVFSGRIDSFDTGTNGANAGVSWLHPTGDRLVELGFVSSAVSGSRWHVGKAGIVLPRGRSFAHGELQLGRGKASDENFSFLRTKLALGYTMLPGRLVGSVEVEYVNVQDTQGALLKGVLTCSPWSRVTTTIFHQRDATAKLDVNLTAGRIDWSLGSARVLAGFSYGAFRDASFFLFDRPGTGAQRELYGGASFPMLANRVTLVWSTLWGESFTRHAVIASYELTFRGAK